MITKKHGLKKNDLIHGGSLTCINHEENLVISPFGPHLLKGICQFNIGYFFGILEFEKTISTMTYVQLKIKLVANQVNEIQSIFSILAISPKFVKTISTVTTFFSSTKNKIKKVIKSKAYLCKGVLMVF